MRRAEQNNIKRKEEVESMLNQELGERLMQVQGEELYSQVKTGYLKKSLKSMWNESDNVSLSVVD